MYARNESIVGGLNIYNFLSCRDLVITELLRRIVLASLYRSINSGNGDQSVASMYRLV